MSNYDYLKLGVAVLFLVTNFLGALFAIRRLRQTRQVGAASPSVRLEGGPLASSNLGKNGL